MVPGKAVLLRGRRAIGRAGGYLNAKLVDSVQFLRCPAAFEYICGHLGKTCQIANTIVFAWVIARLKLFLNPIAEPEDALGQLPPYVLISGSIVGGETSLDQLEPSANGTVHFRQIIPFCSNNAILVSEEKENRHDAVPQGKSELILRQARDD